MVSVLAFYSNNLSSIPIEAYNFFCKMDQDKEKRDQYRSMLVKKLHHHLKRTVGNFFKNGPNPASFLFIFVLFSHHMDKYSTNLTIIEKVLMACLGVEPGASGWKVQTNPLSYGGTP